jgi:hypothetical protein
MFRFKIHNNFHLRNKITKKNYNLPDLYLPAREKIAPPYTSPNLTQNFQIIRHGCLYSSMKMNLRVNDEVLVDQPLGRVGQR